MLSIIQDKKRIRNFIEKAAAVAAALLIWQLAAMWLNQKILLVTPGSAVRTLIDLIAEGSFWHTVWFSFSRIARGFLLGIFVGSLLAFCSVKSHFFEVLLWPFMSIVKATPVASFIILCLIWLDSRSLSVFICFLMVLPVVYTNLLRGMKHMDVKMKEMARLYRFSAGKRLMAVYLPQMKPYLLSAFEISIGMAWKAGIAAEVIGMPAGSIGRMLYLAKIYLSTSEVFAWTIVIVTISVVFEKAAVWILKLLFGRLEYLSCCFGNLWERLEHSESKADYEQIKDFVSEDINIEHLAFSYGEKSIFTDFSLRIPAGEITCLMGASGCGKTTFLRLLTGELLPERGKIPGNSKRSIGMVFQENRLCEDFTAIGNLRLVTGKHFPKEEIKKHLKAVGLEDFADKKAAEFSGGMKRRLAIIRAMLSDSEILILDEPFQGLDDSMRQQVISYLRNYRNGRTMLVVTHEQDDVSALGGGLVVL